MFIVVLVVHDIYISKNSISINLKNEFGLVLKLYKKMCMKRTKNKVIICLIMFLLITALQSIKTLSKILFNYQKLETFNKFCHKSKLGDLYGRYSQFRS